MSTSSQPPYTISFLPPPGPTVLTLRPASITSSRHPATLSPSAPQTFHDALSVRDTVFGDEQNCPWDEEIDLDDSVSWHWVIYPHDASSTSSASVPAATIRLVPARAHVDGHDGDDDEGDGKETEKEKEKAVVGEPNYKDSRMWDGKEPYAMIGRLATVKEFRGRGYGKVLVEEALRWAAEHGGDMVADWRGGNGEKVVWKGLLLIHAQEYLKGWYGGMGWRTDEGLGRWDECGIQHVGMWRRVEIKGTEVLEGKGH